MELTPEQVEQLAPGAAQSATADGLGDFYVLEPLDDDEDSEPSIVVDGVPWDLMALQQDWDDDDPPPWIWTGESWEDTTRY